MRRFLPLVLLAGLAFPLIASASSWRQFSSKSFGFSVKYPAGWILSKTDVPQQVSIQHTGSKTYSLQISVIPVKPARTIGATMARVKAYAVSRGDASLRSVRWSATSLGGRPALAGVLHPPTEGGVAIADGIYVAASKKHVYELTSVAYGARSLAQFPSVYRTMLSSWHFL